MELLIIMVEEVAEHLGQTMQEVAAWAAVAAEAVIRVTQQVRAILME
jgi:hypothetical protein